MPTYQRFEDLPVWQGAISLAEGCEDSIQSAKDRITWSKRDQLSQPLPPEHPLHPQNRPTGR